MGKTHPPTANLPRAFILGLYFAGVGAHFPNKKKRE